MADKKTLKECLTDYLTTSGGVSQVEAKVAAKAIVENLPPVYDAALDLLAFAKKWVDFRNGVLEDGFDIDPKELWFMATQAIAKAEPKG